jgi:hypothetical protein
MGKMRKRFRIREFKQRGHGIGFPIVAAIAVVAVMLVGCGDDDDPMVVFDNGPPSAPDGVYSITGDLQVEICWNPNPEDDIAGYEVYWNDAPTGNFSFVARVDANTTCFIDTDVDNGTTYFYAVLALDKDGLESELSYEDVFDTPRPEGTNLILFDYLGQNSDLSGYDFSSKPYGFPQAWDSTTTDVYFGAPNDVPTLFADQGAGVKIQDYGFIDLIYVDWAPRAGWAPSGQVELIQGHSYIVRIGDDNIFNMAKIHVVSADKFSVTLDWAYQETANNQELAPGVGGAQ